MENNKHFLLIRFIFYFFNYFFLFRRDRQYSVVSLPVLKFYTKSDCELCEQALDKLRPILNNVDLQKVDISLKENERWFNMYRFEIPVIRLVSKPNDIVMRNKEIDVNILRDYLKNSLWFTFVTFRGLIKLFSIKLSFRAIYFLFDFSLETGNSYLKQQCFKKVKFYLCGSIKINLFKEFRNQRMLNKLSACFLTRTDKRINFICEQILLIFFFTFL